MTALFKEKIIGVIGAGTMGAGIAQVAAKYGHRVRLYDLDSNAVTSGIDGLAKGLSKLVERGRMSQAEVEILLARIEPCHDLAEMSDAAVVIEAIVENLQIKQKLFQELESICNENTILASNTSSISVTAIGAALARPENLVGMHFFNPAPVMKLVEVISGLLTSADIATTIADTATAWGKQTVHAKSTPGFIVNRIARPFYAESLRILEEGAADEATLDAILRDAGNFRMGPFELMDLIGHDVNYAVTETVFNAYFQDQRFLPSLVQKELVAGGLLGRKSGQGFYDYREGTEKPAPELAQSDYRPGEVDILGSLGVADALTDLAASNSITVNKQIGDGYIHFGEVTLALTDGRTATQRAADQGIPNLVVFDLMNDYTEQTLLAIAPAMQASAAAFDQAIGFFKALGKEVVVLGDTPGLCLMRTVCMLANEGADTVYQGVCNVDDVDRAMQYGLNYPRGPMQWADSIGLATVTNVLANLQMHYGLDRYRTSLLLQQHHAAGINLL